MSCVKILQKYIKLNEIRESRWLEITKHKAWLVTAELVYYAETFVF
jgi:hypothetical protein